MMSQIPGEFQLLFVFLLNQSNLWIVVFLETILTDPVYIYNQENQDETMGLFMQCIENGHNQVTKAAEKVVCIYTQKGSK